LALPFSVLSVSKVQGLIAVSRVLQRFVVKLLLLTTPLSYASFVATFLAVSRKQTNYVHMSKKSRMEFKALS